MKNRKKQISEIFISYSIFIFYIIISFIFILIIIIMSESFTSLPYQVYKPGSDICPPVLREDTQPFVFPLQDKEKKIIETLRLQYENEANCAGLACPQIGNDYFYLLLFFTIIINIISICFSLISLITHHLYII